MALYFTHILIEQIYIEQNRSDNILLHCIGQISLIMWFWQISTQYHLHSVNDMHTQEITCIIIFQLGSLEPIFRGLYKIRPTKGFNEFANRRDYTCQVSKEQTGWLSSLIYLIDVFHSICASFLFLFEIFKQ